MSRGRWWKASGQTGEALRDLPEVRSVDGMLDYRLRVAASRLTLGDRQIHVDTYNGGLPGPVLRIRPGDTMRLLLHNATRPMGIPANGLPRIPIMTSTNLHTHGLQVSPSGSADNV